MPEGPEIRLAADKIARILVDQPLQRIVFTLPALQDRSDELEGARITSIDTRGKAMLTRFDNGLVLYSHNQLYGRWYTSKLPKLPATNRALRVAFDTQTHTARLYSATDVSLMHESELYLHPFLRNVGPDVLDRALTRDVIIERLQSDRFRRRSLGALYLDQKFLAGVGNYLRSEILWSARVSPAKRPADLDRRSLGKLAGDTLKICRRAYRTRGVTVTDTLAKRLKARGLRYSQYRHYAFTRDREACYACGSEIRRIDVGGRQFYQCPECQPD